MSNHQTGCSEYRALSRRGFLSGSAASLAAAAAVPAWLPQVAYAAEEASTRDVLVSIFLRGGADGLTLCAPHGDPAYYAARPNLAVPRPDSGSADRAIDLDGFFGFPQPFAPLVPAFRAGQMVVVHAAGSVDPTRSHFDAQKFMELGSASDPGLTTGWLGRHLAAMPPLRADATLRGLAVGASVPQIMAGGPGVVPTPNPAYAGLAGVGATGAARTAWLARTYDRTEEPLRDAAANSLSTLAMLGRIGFSTYQPLGGAVYPTSELGRGMSAAAALIRAEVGVEAVHLDVPGWDTHQNQGTTQGQLANLMTALASSLAAFHADAIAGAGARVTVVVMSEFGRMLRENASRGTDHGHGTVMLLMGAKISGGRVLTRWPGLQPEALDRGEALAVTLDYRDVLAEVASQRLANNDLAALFPGYSPTFPGVTAS
jgi:uncharacterized protein (DUF1501 family)